MVSLRAATTSRDRKSIARPPSPASRSRLDEAAHNRTTQRAIGRIYDAFLINAGQVRLLHQRRRAVWRGIDWPRGKECRETKFLRKKKMMDLAFCITVGDHPILALPFSFGGLQFA